MEVIKRHEKLASEAFLMPVSHTTNANAGPGLTAKQVLESVRVFREKFPEQFPNTRLPFKGFPFIPPRMLV